MAYHWCVARSCTASLCPHRLSLPTSSRLTRIIDRYGTEGGTIENSSAIRIASLTVPIGGGLEVRQMYDAHVAKRWPAAASDPAQPSLALA